MGTICFLLRTGLFMPNSINEAEPATLDRDVQCQDSQMVDMEF
jgi:hypothetical protein